MLLAGDIGGTKTVLALFSPEDHRTPLAESTYPSASYAGLEDIANDFLGKCGREVTRAVFGVAGPVVDGKSTITNLPWSLDESRIRARLGLASVALINDLVATASAVPVLEHPDLYTINAGKPVEGGAIAVIAPGTGLGEAFLTRNGSRYRAHASEGGHTDFGPLNETEADLLSHLGKRFGHVSYELVCSGMGIPNIYDFFRESGRAHEPEWLSEQLAASVDPTPVIVQAALERGDACELCAATLDTFISILAAETGNLALKVLATGGVYIGGGIPPRILPAISPERFMQAFSSKGRLSGLMAGMPVHVITNPKTGLLGAAYYGMAAEE